MSGQLEHVFFERNRERLVGFDPAADLPLELLRIFGVRPRLDRLVADVAGALEPGGLLLIGDFDPDAPINVPYHHLPGSGVMTHKRNYAALFEASVGFGKHGESGTRVR